jgi:hypothetical protein
MYDERVATHQVGLWRRWTELSEYKWLDPGARRAGSRARHVIL